MKEVRALMEQSLEVLRIYRHDLMNQVQLLQAYSQMKKFDRLQEPIQALVQEAQRHTEFSSLPSTVISYIIVSRDITYPMLRLHVSYEQAEAPSLLAEMQAAKVIASLLDEMGEASKLRLEPLFIDVWITSFREGYEVGWFVNGHDKEDTLSVSWTSWADRWQADGLTLACEQAEDGMEYTARFAMTEQAEERPTRTK